MQDAPLPAHQTKHHKELQYRLPSGRFVLIQQNDSHGASTGTTIWLGAQVLAVYLHDLLKNERNKGKRAIELGAGCGLLSLTLHDLGWDCTGTDIDIIANGILSANLGSNRLTSIDAPVLEARTLDWHGNPEDWDWSSRSITPAVDTGGSETVLLEPPYDLIVSTDSVYDPSLSQPLLRTLHALSSSSKNGGKRTQIYLAIEVRDPTLVQAFLDSAKDDWDFKISRIDEKKPEMLVGEGGLGWSREDWEGVGIWKLMLRKQRSGSSKSTPSS